MPRCNGEISKLLCNIDKEAEEKQFYFHSLVMKHKWFWSLMMKSRDYEVLTWGLEVFLSENKIKETSNNNQI